MSYKFQDPKIFLSNQLKKGSIVVIVDDNDFYEEVKFLNSEVFVYNMNSKEKYPLFGYGYLLCQKHLGKIPVKRPKMHFQIDFLYFGKVIPLSTMRQIFEFMHPGGYIFYSDRSFERYYPYPLWDTHIAKLKSDEKKFLYSQINKLPPHAVYVELGTYKGGSAVLASIANPSLQIFAVDIWQEQNPEFSIFERHTQFFNNITPIKVNLWNIEAGPELIANKLNIPLAKLSIDFLFIDADHSYNAVLRDLMIYSKYAKFICGHDFVVGNDVHLAVMSYFNLKNNFFWKNQFFRRLLNIYYRFFRNRIKSVEKSPGDSSIWYKV